MSVLSGVSRHRTPSFVKSKVVVSPFVSVNGTLRERTSPIASARPSESKLSARGADVDREARLRHGTPGRAPQAYEWLRDAMTW